MATVVDPSEYFDTPKDADQWRDMASKAEALAAIIVAASEDEATEAEEYGPKTAAMPDPTVYPSSQMKEFLDVGSLPEHLQDEAWRMLSSHEKAFGFNGRLGSIQVKSTLGRWMVKCPFRCQCTGVLQQNGKLSMNKLINGLNRELSSRLGALGVPPWS